MPIDTDDLAETTSTRGGNGWEWDRESALNWIAMYGLAVVVALSTLTTWFILSVSNSIGDLGGQASGIAFPTGRLTLGIAIVSILAAFIADEQRTRGYILFGTGVVLATLSLYFGTDILAANAYATEFWGEQSVSVLVLPGLGLGVVIVASLAMVVVGWRWSENRIAEQLPVLAAGSRLRNGIVILVTILVLMEGANAVFGGASGIVDGTESNVQFSAKGSGGSGSGGSAATTPDREAAGSSGQAASNPPSTPTAVPVSSDDLAVRIVYTGDWQGAIGTDGSMGSIQGYGERIYDVPDDANVVSVNAQKQDDGIGELTVQIIQGNQIVAERSTTAEYGVAQVSETFL